MKLGRDDQRELNNLGKMLPEQGQGHMIVIDEAKAANTHKKAALELLALAREFVVSSEDDK